MSVFSRIATIAATTVVAAVLAIGPAAADEVVVDTHGHQVGEAIELLDDVAQPDCWEWL